MRSQFVNLSKFRKIDQAETLWQKLVGLAKTFEPGLAQAFLQAVEKLRAIWVLDGEVDPRLFEALEAEVQETVSRAAQAEILRVKATLAYASDAPTAAYLVQQEAAELVKEVTNTTRDGIMEAVAAGIRHGKGAAAIAREVRPLIGLTKRQALAVQNYRKALETHPTETLERALRDRRFDAALANPIAPEKIDTMVDAYTRRYLKYRAETIARTESIRVAEIGRRSAWSQLLEAGKIKGALKTWHVAHDERVCPICAPIPDMNPDPIPLDAYFSTPIGPAQMGPIHVDCRCFTFYEVQNA